jgi:hypothetical protein
VAVAHRALGVLGGLTQNRRRDYCGGCQAMQEDTFPLGSAGAALQARGQGGAAPTPSRILVVYRSPASLAAVQRSGVEVEEGPT